ncbi:hypothetical protein NXS19_008797 [Fusarium pseudograminearum]|nr:hypothetical protein NXS19_008797 [Fusarium pseudograminearum]
MGVYPPYPPPAGTPLSPHASEFTAGSGWKNEVLAPEDQTYLPPTEPLNYRRLLDRNVNCNWKYIVDKIVCNNDQQASIFLQQKLKVGTPEQKFEIVDAIVAQAYPLMINRFGNFLVQRCFEHGTPDQVIHIAEAIRGNTLSLSMDPFGCHVVQKAFDSVPEKYKAIMVSELLRRIPETVIHRYACHVWQKLFELRWTESPPQIMKYVNEALSGMWHEVALGETGSLVVQNIFENCLEEDKRPCIEEVLANINIVAHGQFGNWCIQHICEHGAPPDRSRAVDHVIRYAAEYSTISSLPRLSRSASRLVVQTSSAATWTESVRVVATVHASHSSTSRVISMATTSSSGFSTTPLLSIARLLPLTSESTWSPCEVPSLVLVSACSAPTMLLRLVPALAPVLE